MATVEYKCPSCGAPLAFNPDKQMFSCEYCGSDFTTQQIQQLYAQQEAKETENEREVKRSEQARAEAQRKGEHFDEEAMVSYSCPSCGAEVITTESTAATQCFYCQNPVVLGSRLSGDFRPDFVIPFALSKDKAIEEFMKMCGKKKFLPAGFADKRQVEKMQGVYFPYWYVDEHMDASATADAKTTRTWTSGNRRYTETSRYRLHRRADINVNNVAESAISNVAGIQGVDAYNAKQQPKATDKQLQQKKDKNVSEMLRCVHPFDVHKTVPFAMSYLSGFQAEKRDLSQADLSQKVAERMDGYAKSLLEGSMGGYEGVRITSYSDKTLNQDWRYTLLPVWVLTYKFKGEIYPYAINGQTGKTYGKLPFNAGKLVGFGAIVAAIAFIVAMLGGMFFL